MKSNLPNLMSDRPDLLRSKHTYGIWYGMAVGAFFSLFAWGMDAYLLSIYNGFHPWLKLLIGLTACLMIGGFTGWFSTKMDKPLISVVLWVISGTIFAWLIIYLPAEISPRLSSLLEADLQNLLHYTSFAGFLSGFGIAFFWIAIFVSLAGLLQIPLSDSAVFSATALGKGFPMLVVMVLMGICGSILDGLNNEALRTPISAINATIQYAIDHPRTPASAADARRMHVGSLLTVKDLITPERRLIVSGTDEFLGEIQVLVRFEKAWVECAVVYGQPLSCDQVADIN